MFVNGFSYSIPMLRGPSASSQRPAILLVEDNRHPCLRATPDHPRQALKHFAQTRHFAPDTRIKMPHVVDNRPVEFLHRTAAFTPLEVLYGIGPVCHRLH